MSHIQKSKTKTESSSIIFSMVVIVAPSILQCRPLSETWEFGLEKKAY